MGRDAEERTAARDFTMARLAAARASVASAVTAIDDCLAMFVDPDSDRSGKGRAEFLELIDDTLGLAVGSVQLAQQSWEDVDPEEGEPEDEDEGEEDEGEEEDEDDAGHGRKKRRR